MFDVEYHEALLQRIRELREEIVGMTYREAVNYIYLLSREMPEEAARMLIAEMLLDEWKGAHRRQVRSTG